MTRKLTRILATVLACGLVVAVAPALSLRPYLPPAHDFEQALPALRHVGESTARPGAGPVSYRSQAIEAPERFDLVGLAGELRPVEIREREEGGIWSEWVVVADGDPVYTGGSDELQVRARGWRPAGTLHYLNVSGTTSAAESVLTAARSAVNAAYVSVAHALDPVAEAEVPRPPIVRRDEWGADRAEGGCHPRTSPAYGSVRAAVVHHTVTTNAYSESEAPSIVLGICRYHRNANGWNDIGYNALVDRFGNIYEGRDGGLRRAVVGAQAQGFNSQTTGVAAIGTHTTTPASDRSVAGYVHFLAWKLQTHGLEADDNVTLVSAGGSASRYASGTKVRVNRIVGHRRLNYTECPGDGLKQQLEAIRARTQRRIDAYR